MLNRTGVSSAASIALMCVAATITACDGTAEERVTEERAAEEAATTDVEPCIPAEIFADAAGTWHMRSMDVDGSSVLEYELTASGDCSDWLMVAGDRPPVPLRVVGAAGDSIMIEASPYESFLRPGVQVRQRDIYRVQDDRLIGTTEASYMLPAGDSLAHRRSEGTRLSMEAQTP